jgi:hypothetical protein
MVIRIFAIFDSGLPDARDRGGEKSARSAAGPDFAGFSMKCRNGDVNLGKKPLEQMQRC